MTSKSKKSERIKDTRYRGGHPKVEECGGIFVQMRHIS
jgi:hypothetical protein